MSRADDVSAGVACKIKSDAASAQFKAVFDKMAARGGPIGTPETLAKGQNSGNTQQGPVQKP